MSEQVWGNYEYQPSFILAFHGCDEEVGEKVLAGDHLKWSTKVYDWLGHGIYFWEGNPKRAHEWALERQTEGKIKKPFVLGAIVDLGRCLDLFDSSGLQQVKDSYDGLVRLMTSLGKDVPQNVGKTPDRAGRKLDCATVNFLHEYREKRDLPAYDSIRAPFLEGEELYINAGFRVHTHIQICVRSEKCIKGYFRPISSVAKS